MTRPPIKPFSPMPLWLRALGVTTSLLPAGALFYGLEFTDGLSAVISALVLGTLISVLGLILLLVPVALWSAGAYSGGLICAFLFVLGGLQIGVLLGEHVAWACLTNAIPLVLGVWLILSTAHHREV